MNYHPPLLPHEYYHVFSRANGNEKLFIEEENYRFFLQKIEQHILPIADIYAYVLLPNHFHFLIKIKPYALQQKLYMKNKHLNKIDLFNQPAFTMQQFSNCLNSYAKAFNKKYTRKGALFMDYLRRKLIETDAQFSATLFYIHKNPVHHQYCSKLYNWKWSSYNILLNTSQTFIQRKEVLNWFGNRKIFIEFHEQPIMPFQYLFME